MVLVVGAVVDGNDKKMTVHDVMIERLLFIRKVVLLPHRSDVS
jgi:hypothetical protein